MLDGDNFGREIIRSNNRNLMFLGGLSLGYSIYAANSGIVNYDNTMINYLSGLGIRLLSSFLPLLKPNSLAMRIVGKISPYLLMFADTDVYKSGENVDITEGLNLFGKYQVNNQNVDSKDIIFNLSHTASGHLDVEDLKNISIKNLESILNYDVDISEVSDTIKKTYKQSVLSEIHGRNEQSDYSFSDVGISYNENTEKFKTTLENRTQIDNSDYSAEYERNFNTFTDYQFQKYSDEVVDFEKNKKTILLAEMAFRFINDTIGGIKSYLFGRRKKSNPKISENVEDLLYPSLPHDNGE